MHNVNIPLSYKYLRALENLSKLVRLDRPAGIFLLLWPTLTALWIGAEGWPGWHLFVVFLLGTVLTRSAGCVANDLADRRLDGAVERTAKRVLVTGDVSPKAAWNLLVVLVVMSFMLVLTTNLLTVGVAVFAALAAAIYPLMKRITHLPQLVLGLAFSFGIPMAFTATRGQISLEAWVLVLSNLIWVVIYDTAYAMVDREDDLKIGIRSTAVLFGKWDLHIVALLQTLFLAVTTWLFVVLDLSMISYSAILFTAIWCVRQQHLIKGRTRDGCMKMFLGSHWVGCAVFLSVVLHYGI